MKKILVALSMVTFLSACDDSSSASAENKDSTTLSSAEGQGSSSSTKKSTDSSDSRCEECNDEAISSSDNAESNGSSRSSSSEKNAESSSSEKLSEASSSSAGKVKSSSSSKIGCKTETEDDCEYGELTDNRDGQTYKTVKIGDQWWMAENLNFDPGQGGSDDAKYDWSWCYKDNADNCVKYGRLYTWAAATTACPSGWHLPTKAEFETLFTAVGGLSTAGEVLKSTSGWYSSGNGTDAYSFSALPAGYRDGNGDYNNGGSRAYFWSSTGHSSYYAYDMTLYYDYGSAGLSYSSKSLGFSVRCLKD